MKEKCNYKLACKIVHNGQYWDMFCCKVKEHMGKHRSLIEWEGWKE